MAAYPPDLDPLVTQIHATAPLVVINFAGAGVQALAWLHSVGGSSRTVLEATDCYSARALIELIGFEPEHFTVPAVARAMATQAYIRACALTEPGTPVAGVGCTATIATDRTKRGDHRICVAWCNAGQVVAYNITLQKGRSRAEEDAIASLLILRATAEACNLNFNLDLPLLPPETLHASTDAAGLLARLAAGEFSLITAWPEGYLTPAKQFPKIALFSGSFNPLHVGHRQLAVVAEQRLGQPVFFELPLVNADKSPINPAEAERRLGQFTGLAPVLLTTAPLFGQKAKLFPHSMFVIGVDTASRLIQPRFYGHSHETMLAALEEIRVAGCRFLVAGRAQAGGFISLKDLALPAGYQDLFEEIPEGDFRMDISSTQLRQQS